MNINTFSTSLVHTLHAKKEKGQLKLSKKINSMGKGMLYRIMYVLSKLFILNLHISRQRWALAWYFEESQDTKESEDKKVRR